MVYANNPFAPVTTDELVVMSHLKTVLNRIPSEVEQSVLESILEQETPPRSGWISEKQTSEDPPSKVHLIAISKDPPELSNSDLETVSGAGPIDLFSGGEVGVAIEGKTRGDHSLKQLSRYSTALDSDSLTTVSWTELYRTLSTHTDDLSPYPAGIVEDFTEYLDEAGLYKPKHTAESYWQDGVNQIRIEGGDKLNIIWRVDDLDNPAKVDNRKVPWESFCALFSDIEEKFGRDFIRRVFVELEPVDQQSEIDGDTVIGETAAVRTSNENLLRLNYHDNDRAIKLREVNPPRGNTLGSPAGGGETYCWFVKPKELGRTLSPESEGCGFSRSLRRELFLERDRKSIESLVW